MTLRYRLAVLMFTDIVGSTAQRQRLGHEQAEALRATVDRVQFDVVAGHHGTIVKHTGDGVMASFDSATHAVNAATTLQSEFARMSRRLPEPVLLRIGVATGDVNEAEHDLFGMAPIIAARLCATADGGQVLVDDITRQLAGTTDAPFERSQAYALKGVLDPVVAWDVRAPFVDEAPVVPGPLRGDSRFVLAARVDQRAALHSAWVDVTTGRRRLALVSGEAGVGKTRLLAELSQRVGDEGCTVLYGRNDADLVVPYQPFAEAIRAYVAQQPAALAAARLGRSAGELSRLVPDLRTTVSGLSDPVSTDAESERQRLFDAVTEWLSTASAVAPVLLVVDDLHWAADPTIQMLRHIARSPLPMSVLVAGCTRVESADGMSAAQLAQKLGGADLLQVRLDGFDEVTTLEFIQAAAKVPFDQSITQLSALVHEQTAGNVLFARELLLHLVETGVVAQVGEQWTTTADLSAIGIPDGVRRVVTERLGRLSPAAQQVLLLASVVGEEVDARVLAAASELPDETLVNALDECCRARLLDEEAAQRYRFPHGLVRSALYQSFGPTRRALLHRRTVDALETLAGADPTAFITDLAYHAAQGAPSGISEQAIRYNRLAGEQAMAQLAASDAARYFRIAIGLLDDMPDGDPIVRCDLSTALGRALLQAGDPAFAEVLEGAASAARALHDPERLAAVVLAGSRGAANTNGRVDADRVDLIRESLTLLASEPTAGDSPVRARLLGTLAAELHFGGVTPDVVGLADEAVEMARRVGDPDTIAFTLLQRAGALRSVEHLDARRADLAELADLAAQLGDPVAELQTAARLADAAFEAGRHDELVMAVQRANAILDRLGHSYLALRVMRVTAELAMLHGDVERSERELEAMMALANEVGLNRQTIAPYVGSMTKVRAAQGRIDEMIPYWRQVCDELGPTFLPGLGVVLMAVGEREEATGIYRQFADAGFATVTRDITWLHNLAFLTELCREVGTAEEAAVLLRFLTPYANLFVNGGAGCYGCVAHFLGVLTTVTGDHAAAAAWFDAAEHLNDAMHAPLLQATTRAARASDTLV